MSAIAVITYNLIVFLAVFYAVFILGNSGWWFFLCLAMSMSYEHKKDSK